MTPMYIRVDPTLTTTGAPFTKRDVEHQHALSPDQSDGSGVTVAVVDSGLDPTHPVFEGVDVRETIDFTGSGAGDAVGHGTAVSGLIAQHAPGVTLQPLRIFGEKGRTTWSTIDNAYEWLYQNHQAVDLANMSFGTSTRVAEIDHRHNELVDRGVRPITAAGNTGEKGGSPATAEKAYSAGALTGSGRVADFSSFNEGRQNPDVAAVGVNIRLARATGTTMGSPLDENWVKASGTSFSAPITTAAAARWLALDDTGIADLTGAMTRTADDIEGTPEDGAGSVQYAPMLDAADDVTLNVWSFGGGSALYFADDLPSGEYEVDPDDLRELLSK